MSVTERAILDEGPTGELGHRAVETATERALGWALELLSSRMLVWFVTLGGCAAWGYTVWEPSAIRISAATMYCVSVVIPILIRDAKGA